MVAGPGPGALGAVEPHRRPDPRRPGAGRDRGRRTGPAPRDDGGRRRRRPLPHPPRAGGAGGRRPRLRRRAAGRAHVAPRERGRGPHRLRRPQPDPRADGPRRLHALDGRRVLARRAGHAHRTGPLLGRRPEPGRGRPDVPTVPPRRTSTRPATTGTSGTIAGTVPPQAYGPDDRPVVAFRRWAEQFFPGEP